MMVAQTAQQNLEYGELRLLKLYARTLRIVTVKQEQEK